LLAVTCAVPSYGGPDQKPDPDRELAAARALAGRWGGGIKDPARGWALGVGLDSYEARRLVAVRTVWLQGPEVGDRELAQLCDHLRHVPGATALFLEKTRVTDKGLEAVAKLTGLRTLQITDAGLTGGGLGRLADLKDLAILDLARTKVTGEGLRQLKGPKHLKELYLRETRVTDKGLAVLSRFPELEYLDLSDTPVTNAGVARLKGLTGLQFLLMSRTRIEDGALESLAGLRKMRVLSLDGTALTDAGLAPLSGLSQLRSLDLRSTQVGDAGLKHLSGLRHLEGLSLSKSRVTEAGVQHVAGLPHLVSINYDRPGGRFGWLAPAKIPFEKAGMWWGGPRSTRDGKVRLNVVKATPAFLLARLYDTEKKKEIGRPLYHHKLGWAGAQITCWAFSPDGRLVATGSGYREVGFGRERTSIGQIRVWAVPTGNLVATYPHAVGYVQGLAFSKDGKKVLFDAEEYEIDGP
jgi:hypothetical protein